MSIHRQTGTERRTGAEADFYALGDLQVSVKGGHRGHDGPEAGKWEVLDSVLGRGTFLVGPSPRNPQGEALVLAPPGVRIAAPERADRPVSTGGWRVALWAADELGNRYVDVGRPLWISTVSLAYVIGLIELECPDRLAWVANRLERRLINACIARTPDGTGAVRPLAENWRRDAEATLDELDVALSGRSQEIPGEPSDIRALLAELTEDAPMHPEDHEPRLAPGWLRNFYRDLGQDAAAATRGAGENR